MPVSLKTYCVVIAHLLEGAKLRCPIDVAFIDGSPFNLATRTLDCVLAVTMVNPVFGNHFPRNRESIQFITHHGVTWVPVQRQMRRLHCIHRARRFMASRSIAGELVFKHQQDSLFAASLRSCPQLVVDCLAVRRNVFQSPEIETAHLVGIELLCKRDRAFQDTVLLLEGDFGRTVQIFFRSVGRPWRSWPIRLEERAGDIRHLELVLAEDCFCLIDLRRIEIDNILAPHRTNFYPAHAEVARSDVASVIKVRRNFIVNYCNPERTLQRLSRAEHWPRAPGCCCNSRSFDKLSS